MMNFNLDLATQSGAKSKMLETLPLKTSLLCVLINMFYGPSYESATEPARPPKSLSRITLLMKWLQCYSINPQSILQNFYFFCVKIIENPQRQTNAVTEHPTPSMNSGASIGAGTAETFTSWI